MSDTCNEKFIKRNYDTDFSNIRPGNIFPSPEVVYRNHKYRFNKRLFTGEYAHNKKLVVTIDDIRQELPYRVIPINRFELIVNKLDSLLFGNEPTITSGDLQRDKEIQKLVDRTHWVKDIRKGVKLADIHGDAVLKTGRHGVSAFSPLFAYKVVDSSDKNNVKGYVLHELLYDKQKQVGYITHVPKYIRILISCKGYDYERVYQYTGNNAYGQLGNPVDYEYKGRKISKDGNYYLTGIDDCETVQWLSINTEKDGVYGSSAFDNVKDIVFAIENRLSTENWVVDNHGKPILLVGMSSMSPNEKTGSYSPAIIDGKYMLNKGDGQKAEYLTWDGKLDNSKQIRDDLDDYFYELSEMCESFLKGNINQNISEESLNNMMKSALDRGQRNLNDLWYDIVKSLYVLCRLNGIQVSIEELNINFNVGRADDAKVISEVCKTLLDIKLFSKRTLLNKFFGYNEDDAQAEFERIKLEENDNIGGNDDDIRQDKEMDKGGIS